MQCLKSNSKEKEELSDSMGKLHIEGSSSGQPGASSSNFKRKPVIVIVIGMAGNVISLLDELVMCRYVKES